jgi:threonine/homoserine/homoserine lactone efflux protein
VRVDDRSAAPARQSFYLQGLMVGASNPKAVLFFAAFFPQFLDPAAPIAPQFAILASTFVGFEFAVLTLCALGVARVMPVLRSSTLARWINRVCGGLFALMGGLLLLTRRSA